MRSAYDFDNHTPDINIDSLAVPLSYRGRRDTTTIISYAYGIMTENLLPAA